LAIGQAYTLFVYGYSGIAQDSAFSIEGTSYLLQSAGENTTFNALPNVIPLRVTISPIRAITRR
jgi:hypothetical protein